MCTVLLLLRPDDAWPLLIGANRDERLDRPFDPPGRYWPGTPRIVAGRDRLGGGSWLGLNDDGVVATIVNGMDRLGPLAGKSSRGDIVLRALREADAASAAGAVGRLEPSRYRGFTLIVADRRAAFAIVNDEETMDVRPLAPGYHLVTPDGCDVVSSPRYAAHFPAFRSARPPAPDANDWADWIALLRRVDDDDPHRAMTVVTAHDFGTVASTLLAVPKSTSAEPVLLFANGPPTRTSYESLSAPWVRAGNVERG